MEACDKCQCDGGTVDEVGGKITMKNNKDQGPSQSSFAPQWRKCILNYSNSNHKNKYINMLIWDIQKHHWVRNKRKRSIILSRKVQ